MSEQDNDFLSEIWTEILKLHWAYIEEDETTSKLNRRNQLEKCISHFLSFVPNDRKFFLPETSLVLNKSIMEKEDFSAQNAMKGFESISQYANNLCKKPWRKEYKVIKMYSGFYHHYIKKNLVCAEELFLAMGYKKCSNNELILDEAICPDQVSNVSRDCITAYVECDFMRKIKTNMSDIKQPTSWKDIYYIRENIAGGYVQSVKALVSFLEGDRSRRERPSENTYATIKHNQKSHSNNAVSNCTNCMHSLHYMQLNDCAIHPGMQQQQQQIPPPMATQCGIHNGYNLYPYYPYLAHQIPHSKSLEYNENGAQYHLPHRHSSFDQPSSSNHYETLNKSHIYDTPYNYDCTDGHSFRLQHQNTYHSPGNRNPLPATLTNYFPSPNPPPHPPPKISQGQYYGFTSSHSNNKEFNTFKEQISHPPISTEQQFNEFSSSYKKQSPQHQPPNHNETGAYRNRNFDLPSKETNNVENFYNHHSQAQSSRKAQLKKSNNKLSDNKYSTSTVTPTSTSDSYDDVSNRKRNTSRTRNSEGNDSLTNWDFVYQSLENNNNKQQQHNSQNQKNNFQQQKTPAPPPHQQNHSIKENAKLEKTNTSRTATLVSIPTSKTTKPAEVSTWACRFCTFLNEDKTRICAMCARTKDFNPRDSSYNQPTCV